MLDDIYRVLSQRGIYICITYGVPEYRMPYLQKVIFILKKKIEIKKNRMNMNGIYRLIKCINLGLKPIMLSLMRKI